MNLLLLFESDRITSDRFAISGDRARHVIQVLRPSISQKLRVGLLEGPLGEGRVVGLGEVVELECTFDAEAPARPPTNLILAMPRPKSLKKLLPEVTALGVDELVLLNTWRVAKPYYSTHVLQREHHEPLLHHGMMQGGTTRRPVVTVEPAFKPFVEDRIGRYQGRRLVAHPYAERRISSLRLSPDDPITIVVGPEGGLIPYELERLESVGFEPVSIGPRILRVETACVAVLAQLQLLRELGAGSIDR